MPSSRTLWQRTTANQYVREGFAVVRYDKRGIGESTGQYVAPGAANSETIFPILASDLATIVDFFRLDSRIDSRSSRVVRGPFPRSCYRMVPGGRNDKIRREPRIST